MRLVSTALVMMTIALMLLALMLLGPAHAKSDDLRSEPNRLAYSSSRSQVAWDISLFSAICIEAIRAR